MRILKKILVATVAISATLSTTSCATSDPQDDPAKTVQAMYQHFLDHEFAEGCSLMQAYEEPYAVGTGLNDACVNLYMGGSTYYDEYRGKKLEVYAAQIDPDDPNLASISEENVNEEFKELIGYDEPTLTKLDDGKWYVDSH